jgi:hypothetical protein
MKKILLTAMCLFILSLNVFSQYDDWITKENSGFGPWSSWNDIGNGMKFRYICKKESYNGNYQTIQKLRYSKLFAYED